MDRTYDLQSHIERTRAEATHAPIPPVPVTVVPEPDPIIAPDPAPIEPAASPDTVEKPKRSHAKKVKE